MDPWLDMANDDSTINDTATLGYMQVTFTAHYTGNRQPIGLHMHVIHLSTMYPGVNPSNSTINMINQFIDWVQVQQNDSGSSRMNSCVGAEPVPVSQVDSICNGIPQNEDGLLCRMPFEPAETASLYHAIPRAVSLCSPWTGRAVGIDEVKVSIDVLRWPSAVSASPSYSPLPPHLLLLLLLHPRAARFSSSFSVLAFGSVPRPAPPRPR
ncbi:hypothetical protein B0H11DRAFT_2332050 [Mycena galericulata]|nr:hypothetical protein B0H11DRAFT_2332050 [Mycena galericulata]